MKIWKYTPDERDAIAAAYESALGLAREAHESLVGELDAALAVERKTRNSLLMARAMIVEGFLEGWGRDPPASELARYTAGVRSAVILGAYIKMKARRGGRADGGNYDRAVRLCRAAVAAHARMLERGLAKSARRTMTEHIA